jgi:hypothetical protein
MIIHKEFTRKWTSAHSRRLGQTLHQSYPTVLSQCFRLCNIIWKLRHSFQIIAKRNRPKLFAGDRDLHCNIGFLYCDINCCCYSWKRDTVYCRASLLWKPIQGIHPVEILTPKLEAGFSSFEIDSSTIGEQIYNVFLLNKRGQIRPVLSVEPLDDNAGIEKILMSVIPGKRCKRALCNQTAIIFFSF